MNCKEPIQKLEDPHHLGPLKDGHPLRGPRWLHLLLSVHDHPSPPFSALLAHLGPQFTLYPATGLDMPWWRTNQREHDSWLVRSWWLQPLDRWEDFRGDRLKEASSALSYLTTHLKHCGHTPADTLALPDLRRDATGGRTVRPATASLWTQPAGTGPLNSHSKYLPCVTVIPPNFAILTY